jgi:hypothetical protein
MKLYDEIIQLMRFGIAFWNKEITYMVKSYIVSEMKCDSKLEYKGVYTYLNCKYKNYEPFKLIYNHNNMTLTYIPNRINPLVLLKKSKDDNYIVKCHHACYNEYLRLYLTENNIEVVSEFDNGFYTLFDIKCDFESATKIMKNGFIEMVEPVAYAIYD